MTKQRIFVAGAAGLVGQNLIARLVEDQALEIVAVDKHRANAKILKQLHPQITVLEEDLAEAGEWERHAGQADTIVMLQAQIGGLDKDEFTRNNVNSTRRVLEAAKAGRSSYLVHVSSSVVNSGATDLYTESKKEQERIVEAYDIAKVILRPTLMFGWFDRKHLGWLSRFMKRSPIFPIPGTGRYPRQPLYAGDFSNIIKSCIEKKTTGVYNVSGIEKVDYVDLIRLMKRVTGSKALVLKIPYAGFKHLLRIYSAFDRDPPFTESQLEALATPDVFEVIDWPGIFEVEATPLAQALRETFRDARYSRIVLEF